MRFGGRFEGGRFNAGRFADVVGNVGPSFSVSITGLTTNPTHGPSAQIGVELTAVAAGWSEAPPASVAYTWNGIIGTPTGTGNANYTPVAGDDLETISVTATPADTYAPRASASFVVRQAPPVATGSISDQDLTHTAAETTIVANVATLFTGSGLSYAVSGYAGASIDAGALKIDPSTVVAGQTVTLTATNSGGSASHTFTLDVVALAFTAATFTGSGKIGAVHTAAATVNRAGATFAFDYERDGVSIGATDQATYTPVVADDLTDLSVVITATVDGVPITTEPAAIAITYVAPTANGSIPNQSYTQGAAITPLDTSAYFTGSGLSFALAPSSAALPAGLALSSSGSLTGTPTALVTDAIIVVRGTNSGGDVDRAFQLTVADAATAPVLSGLDATGAPDALELDVDIASNLYWSLDPVGTNPDGNTIIAGGVTDSGGPEAISSGENVIAFDFSLIAAGTYDLSFVASNSGALSNVLRQEITLVDSGVWEFTGSVATNVPTASTWVFTGSIVTTVGDN